MYDTMGSGKRGYSIYRQEMRARVRNRHDVVAALERAVESDEIVAYYQPIIDLATGRIAAFEALVRWQRPGQGLVPPAAFLSLAEETGLIVPIGRIVMKQACRTIKQWQTELKLATNIPVTVNLSAKELHDPMLVKEVALTLAQNALPAESLIFEITGTSAMSDAETIRTAMRELRQIGIRFALDDFG